MWMDLFIDRSRPRQITAMLFEQVRDAIGTGRLAPGDRLPTSRWLADDLGVSRSTVTTVYGHLVAEGLLQARVGDGTFVADHSVASTTSTSSTSSIRIRRPAPAVPGGHGPAVDVHIDLRSGRPDPALFPLRDWRRAVRDAVESPPPGYGDPAGLPQLRVALAAWVSRSRGLTVRADQVLVTSGAQQAFDLCAQVLVDDGGVVAFEDPGYEPARRAFARHGADLQPAPVDDQGIVVDAIDPRAQLIFATPSHQSPTGVTMAADRRRLLLEHAYAHDTVIVEDDYDTEFRYVDRPIEPLHRLDPEGRVVYLGTFSKTLSPSLRIGFVVAPTHVIEAFTVARAVVDVQPPFLTQAALTNLIVSGGFERHLRRSRPVYAARHERLQRGLQRLSDDRLTGRTRPNNAGLHALVDLHPDADAAWVAARLAERGVLADPTERNWLGPPTPGLVVGFGLATAEQLDEAMAILAAILAAA